MTIILKNMMEDIIVNFLGAIVFCSLGYFYLVERDNNAQKFIITKKNN